jgi:tetrahydromethanopterin S-methyltransferase subunit H
MPDFYEYGTLKLGYGNFKRPPILIGTMFYQGQTLVERDDPSKFNIEKAEKRILKQKSLAMQYKIPDLLEISADTPKAMLKYLDFYLDHFEPPFVLGGTLEARSAGLEYLNERGIKPTEFIYNAISNLKNKVEIDLLKRFKIQSAVILILASPNMTSTQRYAYITEKNQQNDINIIDGLKKLGIERIWIDGGVINLESLAHIMETQQLISTSLKLPVGTAPNLFLFKYSSPRLNEKFHTRYRRASIMFITTWYSNFIFYGPIEDATECFVSTYQSFEYKKIVHEHNIRLMDS